MENLQQKKDNILNALLEDEGTKAILKRIINEQMAESPYEVACKKLGIKPKPELEDKSDPDEVWADNALRLSICIRAKRMVDGKLREPIYDGSEEHWFPVPDLSDPSGFGFSTTYFGFWGTLSDVGSRLEYFSREQAEEGFEEFKSYYKIHFTK